MDEVLRIFRQLKPLVRRRQRPLLALSQLSRAIEQRASKVPQLSDLRDSGSLERDACIVIFISREESGEGGQPGATELYLAKQRNGPLGIIPMVFDATATRFRNVE